MQLSKTTDIIKPGWFGRNVSVLLTTGKQISGELSEVGQSYLIINTNGSDVQVMVHAIALVRLAEEDAE